MPEADLALSFLLMTLGTAQIALANADRDGPAASTRSARSSCSCSRRRWRTDACTAAANVWRDSLHTLIDRSCAMSDTHKDLVRRHFQAI